VCYGERREGRQGGGTRAGARVHIVLPVGAVFGPKEVAIEPRCNPWHGNIDEGMNGSAGAYYLTIPEQRVSTGPVRQLQLKG
jgi:hypothetical protein